MRLYRVATSYELDGRQRRARILVITYPVVVAILAVILNIFAFGITPCIPATPSLNSLYAVVVAGVLLTVNHTWIMTATELTRLRFRMYATPEEWEASGTSKEDAPKIGMLELERVHNTHRNTTENTVYFSFLALAFVFVTPTPIAAIFWLVGFAIARLGYTYSYLSGKDNARGVFMTLSLLAMYGVASYLLLSLFA